MVNITNTKSYPYISPPVYKLPMYKPTKKCLRTNISPGLIFGGLRYSFSQSSGLIAFPGSGPAAIAPLPAFVVGSSFPRVSAKTVSSIVNGGFSEMDLLLEDSSSVDTPLFSLPGECPSRKRKYIADIQSWYQAFAIFTLVLTSYFPHHSSDLLRYQLIILRTQPQFWGVAWLNYDSDFRREAAALRLGYWSHLNTDLYHFHTRSGVASASSSPTSPTDTSVSGYPHVNVFVPFLEPGTVLQSVSQMSISPFL